VVVTTSTLAQTDESQPLPRGRERTNIRRAHHEESLERIRRYLTTPAYKKAMCKRKVRTVPPLAEARQVDHLVRFRLQREPCYAPQSCCVASEGRRATASRARPTNSGPPYKFRTALQILDRPTN
jgi:hypothetical protein